MALSPAESHQARQIIADACAPRLDLWQPPPTLRSPGHRGDSGGFATTCPNGHELWVPIELQSARITGADRNVAVLCSECNVEFDAAPGHGDVLIDTVGGRLSVRQLVTAVRDLRSAVKQSSAEDLIELQQALREQREPDVESLHGPLVEWMVRHPQAATFLITVLATTIAGLLLAWIEHAIWPEPPPVIIEHQEVDIHIDHEPTDDELEEILRDAVNDGSRSPRS